MKESHGKGPASHPDPESCVDGRKAGGEALTGAHAGQPSSCEIRSSGVPTPLAEAEGHTEGGVIGEPPSDPAQSETLSTRGNSLPGNREVPASSLVDGSRDRSGKGNPLTPATHDAGKSDGGIVPEKSPNKGRRPAEAVEGRPSTKGNSVPTATPPTQSGIGVSPGLHRVREVARRDKNARFTALLHHIDVPLLIRSFYSLKRDAAPGSDGVTCEQYEVELDRRIEDLHRRIHTGRYRASPVKRAFIPKADGTMRPLGIAAVEDKIVQHAVVTVLNQVYEADFLGFSYGFRPGRSAHDALDALFVGIMGKQVKWVLDADIRGFFDTISHEWLAKFIEHRVADPRIVRLIQKWLKAGVSEDGRWSETTVGTPQGAVATPPTMLRTAPFGARFKRAGAHLIHDLDRLRPHFDSLDQRPKNLTPSLPVRILQACADPFRKRLQLADRRGQFRFLGFATRCRGSLLLQSRQSRLRFPDTRFEFVLLQEAFFICVDEPRDSAPHLGDQFVHLLARSRTLRSLPTPPLFVLPTNAVRIAQQRTRVIPYGLVQRIGSALRVGAYSLTAKTIRIRADAPIVCVEARFALPCRPAQRLAIVGVPALAAGHQALQQVTRSALALAAPLAIGRQLLRDGCEHRFVDDRRHGDGKAFLSRSLFGRSRTPAMTRFPSPGTESRPRGHFAGLAELCPTRVRRVPWCPTDRSKR